VTPGAPVVLVLRALGLGDLLTALPALRALADAFPSHRKVLATRAALGPLALLSGAVDEIVDARPLRPLMAARDAPDVGVNLHGRGPQSHRILLRSRPRRTLAFAHPDVPEVAGPAWRSREHEVARWCRLLVESGVPADPTRLDLASPALRAPEIAAGATVIHPGAASPARRWPPERWGAIARARTEQGERVVVTGSRAELPAARAVAHTAGLPRSAVLAGRTDVLELAAVVAAAGVVLCGDTGVAHLATALGTPSLVLFGPTSPREWGPPEDRPRHRALWCGARGDPHGREVHAGLLAITVETVLEELEALSGAAAATTGGGRT
jgi:ADP-heptose:LPS heptosyltransferase